MHLLYLTLDASCNAYSIISVVYYLVQSWIQSSFSTGPPSFDWILLSHQVLSNGQDQNTIIKRIWLRVATFPYTTFEIFNCKCKYDYCGDYWLIQYFVTVLLYNFALQCSRLGSMGRSQVCCEKVNIVLEVFRRLSIFAAASGADPGAVDIETIFMLNPSLNERELNFCAT